MLTDADMQEELVISVREQYEDAIYVSFMREVFQNLFFFKCNSFNNTLQIF